MTISNRIYFNHKITFNTNEYRIISESRLDLDKRHIFVREAVVTSPLRVRLLGQHEESHLRETSADPVKPEIAGLVTHQRLKVENKLLSDFDLRRCFHLFMLLNLLAADSTREDGRSRRVAGVDDDWLVRGVDSVPAQRRQAWRRTHAGGAHRRRGTASTLGGWTGSSE